MAGQVEYLPEGRVLDFGSLPPADYALVISLHGAIRRGDEVLKCLGPGGNSSFMQIKRSPLGNYFAAHFTGEAHGDHLAEPETIEHKRQKEYWRRAAEDKGLTVVTEYPVPGGRLDVAITGGPVATDVEVQHTPITKAAVTRRTKVYARAGFAPYWFNDVGRTRPQWLRAVPFLGSSVGDWATDMPRPGTVRATGLGYLTEVRCLAGAIAGGCPVTARRWPCGKIHPVMTGGVSAPVEEVVAELAAGELMPLHDWRGYVFVVRAAALKRYQEMTGGLGGWDPAGTAARRRYKLTASRPGMSRAGPCRNPAHDQAAVFTVTSPPDEADPYGLGAWQDCPGCQRRYRPVHPSGFCYECR
jgi:hypothetical protein